MTQKMRCSAAIPVIRGFRGEISRRYGNIREKIERVDGSWKMAKRSSSVWALAALFLYGALPSHRTVTVEKRTFLPETVNESEMNR